jgi:uncharacterized membrane protein YcaP (DUF421 family)
VDEILGVVIRVSVLYGFLLMMLRFTGKRGLNSLSPFDFIVGLVLGDMVDDAIWNEIPLAHGLAGVTVILALHVVLALATSRSRRLHDLVSSTPTLVVKNGKFIPGGLAKERTPPEEVQSELRMEGEDTLKEIAEAQWESGGQLSVIKRQPGSPQPKKQQKVKAKEKRR